MRTRPISVAGWRRALAALPGAQGLIGLVILAFAGELGLYWLATAGAVLTLEYLLDTQWTPRRPAR